MIEKYIVNYNIKSDSNEAQFVKIILQKQKKKKISKNFTLRNINRRSISL